IYTTWDRFVNASEITDLYSEADYFVAGIYHALRSDGYSAERTSDAERAYTGYGAQLRILCQNGTVTAAPDSYIDGAIPLDGEDDAILARIRAEIAKQGGPVLVNIPVD